mmetsp:Transcript_26592/g.44524  ORF Transcript_26592/g.44524 Transcript_26592/m.44524 type:complete len:175 (-) Transcript_26592:744-1268(-)|eukprot:CAMPEP_0198214014 /NCGR_PEP_ID=MMETSP1445-20131203/36383_1 /TAXON_ID=36898 /ORGANISM="Pyramimonas sp., Strain CCMP2087" /LENGTH=174 /DNA_ID=CAMNT_0043888953 /DNA_START=66 /DNA_END=590 /DNA_ORIENTATION=-
MADGDSLVESQLRKQAAAHGLLNFQPFFEDEKVEDCAETALREEVAELQSFAGLREPLGSDSFALPSQASSSFVCPFVESFDSPEELLEAAGSEEIKNQLQKLGLKCGGTPAERAARLMQLKGLHDLASIDKNLFAKRKAADPPAGGTATKAPVKGPLLPHQSRRPGQKRLPRL